MADEQLDAQRDRRQHLRRRQRGRRRGRRRAGRHQGDARLDRQLRPGQRRRQRHPADRADRQLRRRSRIDTRFNPATDIGGNTINLGYTGTSRTARRSATTTAAAPASAPLVDGEPLLREGLDGQHVKLYADHALSGSPISLSGGSGENQRLVPTNQAGVRKDTSQPVQPALGRRRLRQARSPAVRARLRATTTRSSTAPAAARRSAASSTAATYYAENVGGACTNCLELWTKKPADGGTNDHADRPGLERRQVAQHRAARATRRRATRAPRPAGDHEGHATASAASP